MGWRERERKERVPPPLPPGVAENWVASSRKGIGGSSPAPNHPPGTGKRGTPFCKPDSQNFRNTGVRLSGKAQAEQADR